MSESRRVAIVAGVGPGIGRSTALGLAGQGYDVAVAARRTEYLDSVVTELGALGVRGLSRTDRHGRPGREPARWRSKPRRTSAGLMSS